MVGDLKISVGTIIKREALRLHPDYNQLKYDERDIVE